MLPIEKHNSKITLDFYRQVLYNEGNCKSGDLRFSAAFASAEAKNHFDHFPDPLRSAGKPIAMRTARSNAELATFVALLIERTLKFYKLVT